MSAGKRQRSKWWFDPLLISLVYPLKKHTICIWLREIRVWSPRHQVGFVTWFKKVLDLYSLPPSKTPVRRINQSGTNLFTKGETRELFKDLSLVRRRQLLVSIFGNVRTLQWPSIAPDNDQSSWERWGISPELVDDLETSVTHHAIMD